MNENFSTSYTTVTIKLRTIILKTFGFMETILNSPIYPYSTKPKFAQKSILTVSYLQYQV